MDKASKLLKIVESVDWTSLVGDIFKSKALSGISNGIARLDSVSNGKLTFSLKSPNSKATDPYEKTISISIEKVSNYIFIN